MLKIFIDGGAVGNPGPAGAGMVIYDEKGKIIKKISEFLGKETNNQAEYHGLIFALIWAKELQAKQVEIYSDSELLVKQIKGEYKIKNKNIKPLFVVAKFLLQFFEKVLFFNIHREKNKEADKLVKMAISLC
ncbi:MAG: ribonuclease HI family protein [Patescibacteria group bacterium]